MKGMAMDRGEGVTGMENRRFQEAFKLEAVELLKCGGEKAGDIEASQGVLFKPVRSPKNVEDERVFGDLEAAKAEIQRLQADLAAAEEELAILKKVIDIFSFKYG